MYPWDSGELRKVATTHPKVYAALGGHASFPNADNGTPASCWTKGSVLDYVSTGGDRWATWNNTVDARAKSWYGYGGNWGDRSVYSTGTTGKLDNYGPSGPGPQRSASTHVVPFGW